MNSSFDSYGLRLLFFRSVNILEIVTEVEENVQGTEN